jgi:hypothetical protein
MKKTMLLFALIVCAFSVTPIQAMQSGMVVSHAVRTLNPEYEGQLPHTAFVELHQEQISFKVALPHAHKMETTAFLLKLFGEHPTIKKITFEYASHPRSFVEYNLLEGVRRAFDDYGDCQ